MLIRFVSRPKFSKLKICYRALSHGSAIKKDDSARFHPLPTFNEVGSTLIEKIEAAGLGYYVHLTGQYYDHDHMLTRNLVMKVGEKAGEFNPNVILDAACTDAEIKMLTNILVDTKECRHVSAGEIDSVGSDNWNYGYTLTPTFSIFSSTSSILQQDSENRGLLHLHTRPGYSFNQKIWMKDVEMVFVRLSDRPWATQKLGVKLQDQQVDIFAHTRPGFDEVEDSETEPSHDELGEIMINTEWIVKCAAQLVHTVSQNRFKNKHVPLYVPKIIQADMNPWVEMRNSMWHSQVTDKLERSRKDYIP